jgi:transforming growth factor-beta-induced protein
VDTLLKTENKAMLQAILKYHVVAGRVPSSEVLKLTSADTLAGKPVTIAVQGNVVKVNTATVTTVDVEGGNGIIHVIDTVLIPPM